MARVITKELALKMVAKLEARDITTRSSAHDEYAVEHEGVQIAVISIRRGSEKDLGHDYVPRDLHISTGQAKRLGQCPWSHEDYLACMREKGILPPLDEEDGNE